MTASAQVDRDTERLQHLGYRQELSRVLGFFDNFSVAFTYLSPVVGIYSLFAFGIGTGGPAYIWLMPIVVIGMLFVALVFGELASNYPVAGSLYQYSKFTVGPNYGWWVGWFYGVALLITVASVDTGVAPYVATLFNNWFGTSIDASKHSTILLITLCLLLVQTAGNILGARVLGRVARYGTYVETFGTFGIFAILLIAGFHHGLGYLFDTENVQHVKSNPLGFDFGGNWLLGAALVAILAHVYIFYGFESAGDIAEETKDAGRQVPRAMRSALVYGGVSSFVLVAGLTLAIPKGHFADAADPTQGPAYVLGANVTPWIEDVLLLVVIYAFFSCGSSVQGAGARLAFSYGRDGAVPGGRWLSHVSPRFKTPVYALLLGFVVPALFALMVNITPSHDKKFLFITYPANVNALVVLVSFATSGIYLSFLMTVIGSGIARYRGWQPQGAFTLGRWGWTVTWLGGAYLALMFLNIVYPSGLSSGRAFVNLDWITLTVMVLIAVVGGVLWLIARPAAKIAQHLTDTDGAVPAQRPGQHDAAMPQET
jgi:amino acid transporter